MTPQARWWSLSWIVRHHLGVWGFIGGAAAGAAVAWLIGLSEQAAPVWSFVGVVVVALVTATLAERRHERQLTAENFRHTERLHHERESALTDSLLQLNDDAVTLLQKALFLLATLHSTYMHGFAPERGSGGRDMATELPEQMVELEEISSALAVIEGRLIVRRGREHPLCRDLAAASRSLSDVYDLLMPLVVFEDVGPHSAKQYESRLGSLGDARQRLSTATVAFEDRAVSLFVAFPNPPLRSRSANVE